MQAILAKKRRGLELTPAEIGEAVRNISSSQADASQTGAFLMATAIKGMTPVETAELTRAMVNSGTVLDFPGTVADKHSTGGVGDKVSLPLAPMLASLGLRVPMLSGRGLEITGGTLDKLESIPGFRVSLSDEEMAKFLEECGCFIASTTEAICPADKTMYSIRNLTSTVDSTPLIVGSILSKKIAEGAKFFVQDIKVGEAAFYKTADGAEELGLAMKETAKLFDLKMKVLLTRMDQPLGYAVGNSLEIIETIDILRGKSYPEDLMQVTLELGAELLVLSNKFSSLDEAKQGLKSTIQDGSALSIFEKMIVLQGVDPKNAKTLCYGNPADILPMAKQKTEFKANIKGYVQTISALKVGTVSFKMGSGRSSKSDTIDLSVGIVLLKKQGDSIEAGETWAVLHHNKELPENLAHEMEVSIIISSVKTSPESLIIKKI